MPDVLLQETTLRVPEADIGRFRDHIFELLSTRTAYELLPDSGKVHYFLLLMNKIYVASSIL